MKFALIAFGLLLQVTSFAAQQFPLAPDLSLTPGTLCEKPTSFRYAERIPYCARSVGKDLKRQVIETYDSVLGYQVGSMNRGDFKIDHFIPLCMGGSNEASNLWPQHSSVYKYTDKLEMRLCEKMAAGEMKQAEAIKIIREAKADAAHCQHLLENVDSL